METFLLLFIILMIVGFGVVGFFLYMEWLRRDQQYVRAHFIYDDENFIMHKFKNIDKKIEYNGKSYTYDDKSVLRKGKRRYIFYRVDVPTPLIFDAKGNPSFSASNLNTLLETDLIDKLFRKDNKDLKLIKLLLFFVLGGIVALGVFYFMTQDKGFMLAVENKDFLIETIREAIL